MMRPEDVAPVNPAAELPPSQGGDAPLLGSWRCCFWVFAYAYGVKGGMDERPHG